MGNSCSLPNRNTPSPSILLELAPRVAGGEPLEIELDRNTLLNALTSVADYIASKKGDITIVAVGGCVNTIYFQSRLTTHDIDFFNNKLKPKEIKLITEASHYAQGRDRKLQNQWLNNHTALFIPKTRQEELTRGAIAQNEVVFKRKGLTVLAAPWDYAICAKLDRMTSSEGGTKNTKPYDVSDAAAYLNRYLALHRLKCIPRSAIIAWARAYATRVSDGVLNHLNAQYQAMYGKAAIDMAH